MTSIVNGYVCFSSCDADAARRGVDPRNPHDDPVKARDLAEKSGKVDPGDRYGPAVELGGSLGDGTIAASSEAAGLARTLGAVADVTV